MKSREIEKVIWKGKHDDICNALRAFYVVRWATGEYEFYPIGSYPIVESADKVPDVVLTFVKCKQWRKTELRIGAVTSGIENRSREENKKSNERNSKAFEKHSKGEAKDE